MKNKTTLITSVMGTIAGIAGIEHGVGEILQGNVRADGLVFTSWPDSQMFANMAGEPAMSLIPNMLISGIFSILISLIFIFWSIKRTHHKYYGAGFLGLSVVLLLVGGGFGPPMLGIILGLATIFSHRNREKRMISPFIKQFGASWKILFSITLACWLFLFPVFPILSAIFTIHNETIMAIVTPAAFLFLALSYFSAGAWDHSN